MQGYAFCSTAQLLISGALGSLAVPMFFAISGYLFFVGAGSVADVFRKMRKRVRTLVIPFVIGCLFFPLFYFLVEFFPFSARFINGGSFIATLSGMSAADVVHHLFFANPIWAFHLWFVRDLIAIVAVTPLLFYVRRIGPVACLIPLVFIVVWGGESLPRSFFFFLLGSFFGGFGPRKWWVLLLIPHVAYVMLHLPCPPLVPSSLVNILLISLALMGISGLCELLVPKNFDLRRHKCLTILCSLTFFVYLFHEPTLNIVIKLMVATLGHSQLAYAVSYLLSPVIFYLAFAAVGYLLCLRLPKVMSLLLGGRIIAPRE